VLTNVTMDIMLGSKEGIFSMQCLKNNKSATFLATVVLIFFIFPFPAIVIDTNNAFAAHPSTEANGIVLVSMRTEPSVIHVGDNFTIHATLVRYSPYGLEVWMNECAGPLQATFDKNVAVEKGMTGCPPNIRVRPTITIEQVSTPLIAGDMFNRFTDHFKATSAGITNATLNLEYQILSTQNRTIGFNRENALLISCFQDNKMFSPCSFEFTILP
jgi:hypothetical protein